jgi:hypothetical protein
MSNAVTIHKSRIIRLLKQHPSRMKEMFPPDRFDSAAQAIKALESSPHNWFIDGTLAENERVAAKVTNIQTGKNLVSLSRNAVSNVGIAVTVIDPN